MSEPTTYRFGPRPKRGVALGLSVGQAVALGAGIAGALLVVLATRDVVVALFLLAASGAWAFLPLRGRPPHAWVAPMAAQLSAPKGARAPLTVRSFGTGMTPLPSKRRADAACNLPGLGALSIRELESPVGAVALVTGGGPACFTLSISGRRFALEDESVQAAVVGSWGSVLNACAAGNIRRLQVTERAAPESGAAQRRWLGEVATGADAAVLASYRAHLQDCLLGAFRHEVYLTAALRSRLARADAASECAALVELLHSAGFEVRPLGARSMGLLLASMLTPGSPARPRRARSWERRWDLVRTEGACHACYEAAELPRVPVRADWTWPLLQRTPPGTTRRWALHIELAPPAAGLRRAQRAVLAHEGDEAVRAKWGFRSGARTLHEADSARTREQELAAGFADARFVLLLALSAPDPEALSAACRQAEAQAATAGVELRRLYGQQAEALVSSLPLTRLRLAGGWS